MARIILLTVHKRVKNLQVGPPLGLCYLSSSLKAAGHEVRLFDLRTTRASFESTLPAMREFAPDLVGFSSMVFEADELARCARVAKALPSLPRVIVGGPIAGSIPDDVLAVDSVDAIVHGEGERVIVDVADALDAGAFPENIPGLLSRGEDGTARGGERELIADLDALPFPDWGSLDLAGYHNQPHHGLIYARREYMPVATARGCPYRCVFCHDVMGKRFRTRSAQNVVDEFEILAREHGIGEITIADDCFNLDKQRADEICDLVAERNLDLAFSFPVGMRGDVMEETLLRKLKAIGTYKIAYGVETGSPRLQKTIRKNVNLARLKEVIEMTGRLGILVQGFFMFGFPGETEDDLAQTVRYCLSSRLDLASFNIVNVFPGTELYDTAVTAGVDMDARAAGYDFDSLDNQLSDVPTARLKRIIQSANFRFYLAPTRLARILTKLPNKRQAVDLAWYFVQKVFLFLRG